jgi:hypothetical protein
VAVSALTLVVASSGSAAAGDRRGTGALTELRSGTATFVPTSDDGLQGVLVMPAPKATFDPDPSDRRASRLPAQRAATSLGDEPDRPNRPSCTHRGAVNDNVVRFTVGLL